MEKGKPAEQTYVSHKVLGKLYDQVERVAFNPAFTAPFDARVLNAFHLKEEVLDEARSLKRDYDAHMHRIMAQHAIKTEFEVWSTFVMEHNSSNDFKFHEQIGSISSALKDRFRNLCVQRAGGKQYEVLGPFVAAMYKATSDEMAIAVKQCSEEQSVSGRKRPLRMMRPDTMPLMSFPWLFQDVLGRIAKLNAFGSGQSNSMTSLMPGTAIAHDSAPSIGAKKSRNDPQTVNVVDDIKSAEGITHRGGLLELQFGDSKERSGSQYSPDRDNAITRQIELPAESSAQSGNRSSVVDSSVVDITYDHTKSDFPRVAATLNHSESGSPNLHANLHGNISNKRMNIECDSQPNPSHSNVQLMKSSASPETPDRAVDFHFLDDAHSQTSPIPGRKQARTLEDHVGSRTVLRTKEKASDLDLSLTANEMPKRSETESVLDGTTEQRQGKMSKHESEKATKDADEKKNDEKKNQQIRGGQSSTETGKEEGEGDEEESEGETVQLRQKADTMHDWLADFAD